VEPSRYVNAINVPEWRNQVVLKKGQVYGAQIVYRGWEDAWRGEIEQYQYVEIGRKIDCTLQDIGKLPSQAYYILSTFLEKAKSRYTL